MTHIENISRPLRNGRKFERLLQLDDVSQADEFSKTVCNKCKIHGLFQNDEIVCSGIDLDGVATLTYDSSFLSQELRQQLEKKYNVPCEVYDKRF